MYLLLILIMLLNCIVGNKLFKTILNPITIYNFIWLAISVLYKMELSGWQKKLKDKTCVYLIVISIIFTFFCSIAYLVIKYINCICIKKRKIKNNLADNNVVDEYVVKNANFCFYFWVLIEIVEIIFSKGVPLLWILIGSSKTYFDFGIPTIHGFANALGLSVIMIYFYEYLTHKKRKYILRIGFILTFFLIVITRQVIVTAIIQMFIVYCFYIKRVPYKVLILLSIMGTLGFGIIGNIRTGYDNFLYVSLINTNIPSALIGIYWVYMYLTMTLANVNNLLNISIDFVGLEHIFRVYLPTVISGSLFENSFYVRPDFLVTSAYNVSGYFADFYVSFGFSGVIVISMLYGLFSGIVFTKLQIKRSAKNIIYYSIILQILALSFFVNMLMYLPVCFQFIIIHFMFYKYTIK